MRASVSKTMWNVTLILQITATSVEICNASTEMEKGMYDEEPPASTPSFGEAVSSLDTVKRYMMSFNTDDASVERLDSRC